MSDLISRQEAIERIQMFIDSMDKTSPSFKNLYRAFDRCIIELNRLPSVEPERKKGRWEMEWLPSTNGGHYQIFRCNQCHEALNWQMNFCGNCGADMRGDENETD